jgi:hypothetical protein
VPGCSSQLLISVPTRATRCTQTRPGIRFASAGDTRPGRRLRSSPPIGARPALTIKADHNETRRGLIPADEREAQSQASECALVPSGRVKVRARQASGGWPVVLGCVLAALVLTPGLP